MSGISGYALEAVGRNRQDQVIWRIRDSPHLPPEPPHMFVMEVIVTRQDRARCASITCITGTYAEPEERVIFDRRHNAGDRLSSRYMAMQRNVAMHAQAD
jgi:hypothetical protein